jgi:hypothetical protein
MRRDADDRQCLSIDREHADATPSDPERISGYGFGDRQLER